MINANCRGFDIGFRCGGRAALVKSLANSLRSVNKVKLQFIYFPVHF
jgi:hypothetical protein